MGDGKKFISEGMHLGSYTGEGRSLCGECEAHEVRTRGEVVSHFFFAPFSKILISKDLRGWDGSRSCQNIEPQGVTGKILQNKDLAFGLEPRRLVGEHSLGSAVCID